MIPPFQNQQMPTPPPSAVRSAATENLEIQTEPLRATHEHCNQYLIKRGRRAEMEMSNPMKYIKNLEAVGFERNQAEAQVQMMLEVLEGDLVTKSDFAIFQERLEHKFAQLESYLDNRFAQVDSKFAHVDSKFSFIENKFSGVDTKFIHHQQLIQNQIKESEFRLMTRLGFLVVSTVSIAVATLTWLIKI